MRGLRMACGRGAVIGVLVSAALAGPSAAAVAPGDPDPAFGAGGVVRLDDWRLSSGRIHEALPDALGNIVAAGPARAGDDPVLSVVRYTATGARDTAFGTGGEVLVPVPGEVGQVGGLGRQPGGRILVLAGARRTASVVGLTADGRLDPSFGTAGLARLPDQTIGGDQRMVVDAVGRAVIVDDEGATVRRLTPDGLPDATFGPGGVVTPAISSTTRLVDVVATGLGDVTVVGTDDPADQLVLARLRADGSADPAFGTGGVRTSTDISNSVRQLVARPGGGYLVGVGTGATALTATGALDTAFGGGDGRIGEPADNLVDIALDGLGRIYFSRVVDPLGAPYTAGVMRFTADGTPDTGFGVVRVAELSRHFFHPGRSIVGEATGVLLFGTAEVPPENGGFGMLTRMRSDGTRDPSTGPNGLPVRMGFAHSAQGVGVVVTPSGRTLVGGWAGTPEGGFPFIAGLGPGGELDPAYGTGGRALVSLGSAGGRATAIAADGEQAVVTGVRGSGEVFAARRTASGAPDPAFGAGGWSSVPHPGLATATAETIASDGAGRYLVAGIGSEEPETLHGWVTRLTATGLPDPAFSQDGFVRLSTTATNIVRRATAVQPGPGGTVVVGGTSKQGFTTTSWVTRLTATGEPDPSFGTEGTRAIVPPGGDLFELAALRVDAAGRILAVGRGSVNGAVNTQLRRLTATGADDPSYDGDGLAVASLQGDPIGMAVDGVGRIVLALRNGFERAHVGRILPDGREDASFGGGQAFVTLPAPVIMGYGGGVAIRPGNGIVVAAGRAFQRGMVAMGLAGEPVADPAPGPGPGAAPNPAPAPGPKGPGTGGGGLPPAKLPARPPAPGSAGAGAALSVAVSASSGQSRSSVRRRGLRVKVRCATACRAEARVALRRGVRPVGSARSTRRLKAGAASVLTLKLGSRARSALARRGRVDARVTVKLTPSTGGEPVTRRVTVRLR